MTAVTAFETLPPPPIMLPHELEVPDDLLLPGVIGDIFAAGVASLIILANQEQSEGGGWIGIPFTTINELAHRHCGRVTAGERGGDMFADNPLIGVQVGLEILDELRFVDIQYNEGSVVSIALTRRLIDDLRTFRRR